MTNSSKTIVWTIAGSDSGGGAGIQADLKTFFDLGVHGCSAITAVTAQNTETLVQSETMNRRIFSAQLDALASDLAPAAIKIGVLPNREIIDTLVNHLSAIDCFVICDPVLKASSGNTLTDSGITADLPYLYPFIDLLTPNIPEAEALTGIAIENTSDMEKAAQSLLDKGVKAVLIKGGHSRTHLCQDYFTDGTHGFWLSNYRQESIHNHGTGCTLSSAIAAFIGQGKALRDALVLANAYVQQGIRTAQPLGQGPVQRKGPVHQAGWPTSLGDFPQISTTATAVDLPSFKRCDSLQLGLYPIVDSLEWLEKLLPLGIQTIQLRMKDRTLDEMDGIVKQTVELGKRYQARLFINDYWQLAIKHNAYGVHLGQEDLDVADLDAIRTAGVHLGLSTHSEFEWARAATFKPSYLALGTVFPTQTKPAILIGLENLDYWTSILCNHYPLVAIGGIKQHNLPAVMETGIGSIAVATAITEADNYTMATETLRALMKKHQAT